jgi:hypothetical protein
MIMKYGSATAFADRASALSHRWANADEIVAPDNGQAYPVVFYSGRGDNQDVYILYPGEKDPRNLTDHPAWDGWASFVPTAKPESLR